MEEIHEEIHKEIHENSKWRACSWALLLATETSQKQTQQKIGTIFGISGSLSCESLPV
jgi:hypothetical protein